MCGGRFKIMEQVVRAIELKVNGCSELAPLHAASRVFVRGRAFGVEEQTHRGVLPAANVRSLRSGGIRPVSERRVSFTKDALCKSLCD